MKTKAFSGRVTCPIHRANKCLNGIQTQVSRPMVFLFTPPPPFPCPRRSGCCGPPGHHDVLWLYRSCHICLPAHAHYFLWLSSTLSPTSLKPWQWVFYSLPKMLPAICPQIHPPWAKYGAAFGLWDKSNQKDLISQLDTSNSNSTFLSIS